MKNKRIIFIALFTALILMIPLTAMQFTDEVNWTIFDFSVMGILLFSTGMAYELITKNITNRNQRIAVGIALLFVFLAIWAQLAVGVFSKLISGSLWTVKNFTF